MFVHEAHFLFESIGATMTSIEEQFHSADLYKEWMQFKRLVAALNAMCEASLALADTLERHANG